MQITIAKTEWDYEGILSLQAQNMKNNISLEESQRQGFLTVKHDLPTLKKIQGSHAHIIAKNEAGEVIGFTLVMLREYSDSIPILVPMFEVIDQLIYDNQKLVDARYFVMGQVCVDKRYRGQNVFRKLYEHLGMLMKSDYDYIITEISKYNMRSIAAHNKVGFNLLHEYASDENENWLVVAKRISE